MEGALVDSLGLADRRVVLMGASRSIGRAMAVAFARNGAKVSVCGRDEAALAETAAECTAVGAKPHVAACDVSDADAVEKHIAAVAAALGGIDVLVNNASAFARAEEDGEWERAFETDLMATVRATRAALPYLERAGDGAVVHVSSISALKPTPGAVPYGALKAAIVQLTKSQAYNWGKLGIRVNSVAPGSITAPGHMWEKRRERNDPAYTAAVSKIVFGRLGTAEEVADVTLFLASPLSRWITGQTIVVDGGQTLAP
jgi:3-oxoacyl-[acyl-carrier protein] reductase